MDDPGTAVGGLNWPIEDFFILYSRIEAHIPKNDKIKFTLSEVKLPWQKIAFGTHTAEECFDAWKMARSPVRSFRLITEMVIDARSLTQRVLADNCSTTSYDPKPKKPPNIFAIFAKEYRALHPEVPHNQQFKEASEEYHKLSDFQKEKYKKKLEKVNIKYQEEMSEYRKKYPELLLIRTPTKGRKKSALTPFNVFFDEQEKDMDNYNMTALRKQYKDVWNNMSDTDKLVWMEKAHEIEQNLGKNIHVDQNIKFTKKGNVLTKKEILIRDKALGKPPKPPVNSYQIFRKKLSKLKDPSMPTNIFERSKWFSEKWKSVSSKEKEEYNLELAQMKEEYNKHYAAYLKSLNHRDIEETSEPKTVCLAEPKKKKKKKPAIVDEVDEVEDEGTVVIVDHEEEKKNKKKQHLEGAQMHAEEQVESHEERREKKKKKKSKVEPELMEEQQGLGGTAVVGDDQMYAEENIILPEERNEKKKKKSKAKPELVEDKHGYDGIAVQHEIHDQEYRTKKKKHKRDRKKSESNLNHEEVQIEEQEVVTLNDDHVNLKKRKRKDSKHDESVKFETSVAEVPENEPDQQMIPKKKKKKKRHHSE